VGLFFQVIGITLHSGLHNIRASESGFILVIFYVHVYSRRAIYCDHETHNAQWFDRLLVMSICNFALTITKTVIELANQMNLN